MTNYELEYRKNPAACGEPFPEIVDFFKSYPRPFARVLDFGCGQGRDALFIARLGHQVVGLDLSPTGISQMLAHAQAEALDIEGEVADVRNYSPRGQFDVVLLDRVIHMLANQKEKAALLEKAMQATTYGGFLLIADTPKNIPGIEVAFLKNNTWQLWSKRKGFRFYQKLRA